MTSRFETYVNGLAARRPTRLIDVYGLRLALDAELRRVANAQLADRRFAERIALRNVNKDQFRE